MLYIMLSLQPHFLVYALVSILLWSWQDFFILLIYFIPILLFYKIIIFYYKSNYLYVYFLFSGNMELLYCPNNCGRYYSGDWKKSSLQRHLKHECGVPKKFICLICYRRFARKTHLNSHTLIKHQTRICWLNYLIFKIQIISIIYR